MDQPRRSPTIQEDGWTLESAEDRATAHPDTFQIPPRAMRESLSAGDGVKLLFDIETREGGQVIDRGVDRMWVIVTARTPAGYIGFLDSDPGIAENLKLRAGDLILFGPGHVAQIGHPPRDYVIEKYGASVFED